MLNDQHVSRQLTIKRSKYASMFKSLILDSTSSELPLIMCIKYLFQIRLRKYEIEFKFKDTVGFVFWGVFFFVLDILFFLIEEVISTSTSVETK